MEARNEYEPRPFEKTLTLADGTKLAGSGAAIDSKRKLWLWVDRKYPMAEIFALFSDSEKTAVIRADYSEISGETFEGFTHLSSVQENLTTNEIQVLLIKN